jgi:hypothetical protein
LTGFRPKTSVAETFDDTSAAIDRSLVTDDPLLLQPIHCERARDRSCGKFLSLVPPETSILKCRIETVERRTIYVALFAHTMILRQLAEPSPSAANA